MTNSWTSNPGQGRIIPALANLAALYGIFTFDSSCRIPCRKKRPIPAGIIHLLLDIPQANGASEEEEEEEEEEAEDGWNVPAYSICSDVNQVDVGQRNLVTRVLVSFNLVSSLL